MLKKIMTTLLIMVLMGSSLVVSFAGDGYGDAFGYGHGNYENEDPSELYYYGNRSDKARLDENTKGKLMVQYYDVSDISWNSNSSRALWTRTNMFSENRVINVPVMQDADHHNGYGVYYDDYVFYKNGAYTNGAISKTAQRIWGYYKPDKTGWYKFKVTSDDGHYFKIFNDDIYNSSSYDHYNDGTYANQWNRFYNNGQLELDNMIITSNVVGKTEWRYMKSDEIYPVFLEYFNWGGEGKFIFEEAYTQFSPSSYYNPYFYEVNKNHLYAGIIGEPSQNGNSGIDITVANGIRKVHAYDDFDDNTIDSSVWTDKSNFYERYGVLYSSNRLAKIQLKNEYADYDAYKIQVSLVNIGGQNTRYSNGGIGISDGSNIWVNQLQLTKNGRQWSRYFDVTKYGTVSSGLPNGEYYKDVVFDTTNNANYYWKNKPLRLVIDANKSEVREGYNVVTSIYEINGDNYDLLKTIETTSGDAKLDFNKIFLADLMPYNNWSVSFDDFDFVATKDTRFTSLSVSHKNNEYILDWEPIDGAQRYVVYYGNDENSVGIPYGSVLDAATTTLAISDTLSPFNNKFFKVVAVMDDKEIGSNTVKLNGNVTMSTLQGQFSGADYLLSWNSFATAEKYQLYYGETPSTVDSLLPGADAIGAETLSKLIENLDSTSPYYNKYFQLRAIDDEVVYYSNVIKVEDNLRLGLEHKNDTYYLKWSSDATFASYNIYYGDSSSNVTSFYATYDENGRVAAIADTDVKNSKYFKVVGIAGSRRVSSNVVRLNGNVTVPELSWSLNAEGQQVLNWGAFDNPDTMTLYYGDKVDAINTVMSNPQNLPNGTTQYITTNIDYLNKFIQLKFVKAGVTYYTNVVRSSVFPQVVAEVNNSNTISGQKNLVIDWTNVPDDIGYEVWYINSDAGNEKILISGGIPVGQTSYTIEDIYGDNKHYLNKEIYVVAKYSDDVAISSPSIIAQEVIFDTFEGVLDEQQTFKMDWMKPKVVTSTDQEELDVTYYTIQYGPTPALLNEPVEGAEKLDALTFSKQGVANDSSQSGNMYYNKHFVVSAMKDGVYYDSNTIYSGEKPVLSIDKYYGDDFKLHWPEVENADSIIVMYKDADAKDYSIYSMPLDGNETKIVIADVLTENQKYDHNYFVIAAEFNGFKIVSDPVYLSTAVESPVISGRYSSNDYKITWKTIADATSIDIIHVKRDKNNDNALLGTEIISANNPGADTSFVIKDAKNTVYYEEYIQIRATVEDDNGNIMMIYSNEVFVEESIIDGTNPTDGGHSSDLPSIDQGEFDGDIVKLRMGNEFEIVYKFKVNKDMYNPYFKVTLKGNEYLSYDKIVAGLYDVTSNKKIAVRMVMEADDASGNLIVYVHPKSNDEKLISGNEYKVTLNSTIDVIDETKVYNALYDLPTYNEDVEHKPKNWELPYYISKLYDKSNNTSGTKLDHDMRIKYEVEWNSSNSATNTDVRENTKELFELDIQAKDKRKLPDSI